MKGKISVIIPVYNVEEYLEQCIESVINQSYFNIEIILIDDGSQDKSGYICDLYAKKDSRIKVIHQKNGGAANAKNTGLKLATGEYLSFVDSDDYLEKDAYMFMIKKIQEYNADVIQCSFREIYVNRSKDVKMFHNIIKMNEIDYLKLYTQDWSCGLLWDKLYKRKIFEGIYFEEGHKIDDEFFTYLGIMNSNTIVRIPYVTYNYRKRLSGIMLSQDSQEKIIIDTLQYLTVRRNVILKKFPTLKQLFDDHYLNMLIILSKKPYGTEQSISKIKCALKNYYKEDGNISMGIGLKIALWNLKYKSVKRLLKEKDEINNQCISEQKYYFR